MPKRIQRSRAAGWRMPPDAVYVGRPSSWGNPFRHDDERAPWMALALGYNADALGRRTAAVAMFRWWITGGGPADLGRLLKAPIGPRLGGELEYADGTLRPASGVVYGLGLMMFLRKPLVVGNPPDLAPLRGRDLVCWCPPGPCHADTLLELTA